MAKYALTETVGGKIREIKDFGSDTPPILSPFKGAQWQPYTPPPPPPPTAEEIAAAEQQAIRQQLAIDAKASAMFANLQGATLVQINTYVDSNFAAMNATQRNFIKLLAAAASLYLQER